MTLGAGARACLAGWNGADPSRFKGAGKSGGARCGVGRESWFAVEGSMEGPRGHAGSRCLLVAPHSPLPPNRTTSASSSQHPTPPVPASLAGLSRSRDPPHRPSPVNAPPPPPPCIPRRSRVCPTVHVHLVVHDGRQVSAAETVVVGGLELRL
jgi:hypothetical protein